MTTYALNETDRRLEELAEREREAWNTYRDDLSDLDGRSYDEVEPESWEQLQQRLRALAAERSDIAVLSAMS